MPKNTPYDQRIIEKTIAIDSGCWLWTGAKKPTGYGNFLFRGKFVGAHVASHEVFIGPIGKGLHVCHSCDNPSCVRPEHLFLGTPSQNQKDCTEKGRKTRRGLDRQPRRRWTRAILSEFGI